jgi:tetratricopeptide (TPR) repeat protein
MPQLLEEEMMQSYGLLVEKGKKLWESARIACFTKDNVNIPMWNFYADEYKGICLEYKASDLPEIEPVIYTNELPEYNKIMISVIKTEDVFAMSSYCELCSLHKSMQWKYEDEWRLLDCEFEDLFEDLGAIANEIPPEKQRIIDEFIEKKIAIDPEWDMKKLTRSEWSEFGLDEIADQWFETAQTQNGKPYKKLIKPIRIYLGHKIEPKIQDAIVAEAKLYNIEVLKMGITTQGYVPFPLEKIVVQGNLKKSNVIKQQILRATDNGEYGQHVLQLCNKAIELYDEDAELFSLRGCVFGRMKKLDCAENDFRKAIKIKPDNYLYHGNLACILLDIAVENRNTLNFIGVVDEANAAIKLFSAYSNGYITISTAYAYLGKIEDALIMFENGLNHCDKKYFLNRLKNHDGFNELMKNNSDFEKAFKIKFSKLL